MRIDWVETYKEVYDIVGEHIDGLEIAMDNTSSVLVIQARSKRDRVKIKGLLSNNHDISKALSIWKMFDKLSTAYISADSGEYLIVLLDL